MKPRILVIDDERPMFEAYQEMLKAEGYEFNLATSVDEAMSRLAESARWDVILLDQRLRGHGDVEGSGLTLLQEIRKNAPDASVFVITGYPQRASIRSAIDHGVTDYLEKGEFLKDLLPYKVRQAVGTVRDRRLSARTLTSLEAELVATWDDARVEADASRKGEALERTLVLLFKTIPGLQNAVPNRQNEIEEIDVMVRNEAGDPWLSKQSDYLFVECKNWSRPVGVEQARSFLWKLHHSFGRARLGIFVAMSGVTAPFRETLRRESAGDKVVVLLDADGLDAWIMAPDRGVHLKQLVDRAVV